MRPGQCCLRAPFVDRGRAGGPARIHRGDRPAVGRDLESSCCDHLPVDLLDQLVRAVIDPAIGIREHELDALNRIIDAVESAGPLEVRDPTSAAHLVVGDSDPISRTLDPVRRASEGWRSGMICRLGEVQFPGPKPARFRLTGQRSRCKDRGDRRRDENSRRSHFLRVPSCQCPEVFAAGFLPAGTADLAVTSLYTSSMNMPVVHGPVVEP
jgi:hypothetical protein